MPVENKPDEERDVLHNVTVKADGSFLYSGGPHGPFSAGSPRSLRRLTQAAKVEGKTIAEILIEQGRD